MPETVTKFIGSQKQYLKILRISEIIATFAIIILGQRWHSFYKWWHYPFVSAFAPVNESIWEHTKIFFFPLLVVSLVEYFFLKGLTANFVFAKAIEALVMIISMIVGFITFSIILGRDVLAISVTLFVISIVIGQIVSYLIIKFPPLPSWTRLLGWSIILLIGLMLICFTYWPPRIPLIFLDTIRSIYGIP
jgi:hypothetical protein